MSAKFSPAALTRMTISSSAGTGSAVSCTCNTSMPPVLVVTTCLILSSSLGLGLGPRAARPLFLPQMYPYDPNPGGRLARFFSSYMHLYDPNAGGPPAVPGKPPTLPDVMLH